MIEYRLRDAAGNTFNLNTSAVTAQLKETTTQELDAFKFENKIAERSYLPGAILIGKSRLASREFTMSFERLAVDDATYRSEINSLMAFLVKTVYIEDITNDMRLKVAVQGVDIDYGDGALKKFSMNTITFVALNPFWEALTVTSYTGSIVADTIEAIDITNEGFLETPPIIQLVTTAAIDNVECYLQTSNIGIRITDALFGTAGNLTMTIDCGAGTVIVGTTQSYNRNVYAGTGYFHLPVGDETLNILCADQAATYTVTFRKRYFI